MTFSAKLLNSDSSQQPGWHANLALRFAKQHGKTVLTHRQHHGPLLIQRPFYPEGEVCHVYVLHPPGGVVAGDCLNLSIHAEADSAVLITTPAANKFYRSDGLLAQQHINLNIAAGASLEWLPQETLFYEGARVNTTFHLELAADARFLGWEIGVLGRPAAHEGFAVGDICMNWHIFRANDILYRERLHLDAQAFAANWGLQAHSAYGSLFAYPAGLAQLTLIQALIGDRPRQGVTLLDNLLICRALDHRADCLRGFFQDIWHALRPDLLQRSASVPRIWAS